MKQGSALLAAETYPWADRTGHPREKTYTRRPAQDSSKSGDSLKNQAVCPRQLLFRGLSKNQAVCPRQFHFWRLSEKQAVCLRQFHFWRLSKNQAVRPRQLHFWRLSENQAVCLRQFHFWRLSKIQAICPRKFLFCFHINILPYSWILTSHASRIMAIRFPRSKSCIPSAPSPPRYKRRTACAVHGPLFKAFSLYWVSPKLRLCLETHGQLKMTWDSRSMERVCSTILQWGHISYLRP